MDEKLRMTFEKVTAWLNGEKNDKIERFFKGDQEAYEVLLKLMANCTNNGWMQPGVNLIDYADSDGMRLAWTIYHKAR